MPVKFLKNIIQLLFSYLNMLKLDKSLVRICINIYISITKYNLFRKEMSPILKIGIPKGLHLVTII